MLARLRGKRTTHFGSSAETFYIFVVQRYLCSQETVPQYITQLVQFGGGGGVGKKDNF